LTEEGYALPPQPNDGSAVYPSRVVFVPSLRLARTIPARSTRDRWLCREKLSLTPAARAARACACACAPIPLQPRYGYFTDMDTADRVPFVQRFAREGAAAAVAARLSGSATERFLQVGPCPNLFEASQFRHV